MSEKPIQRKYTPNDLRALWNFCCQDFEGFLELMIWLDSLPENKQQEQVDAAHSILREKSNADQA